MIENCEEGFPASNSKLGNRLAQVAKFVGSQAKAAELMSVSLSQFKRYLSGENTPTVEAIANLAKRTSIRLEWLVFGLGQMSDGEKRSGGHPATNAAVDEELSARIFEAVAVAYESCGLPLKARDQGRAAARMYNEIAAAGAESWEEKMGAVRLAASQLRRRLQFSKDLESTAQPKHWG